MFGSFVLYLLFYFKYLFLLLVYFVGIILVVKFFCLFVSVLIFGIIVDKYNKVRIVLLIVLFSYIVMNFFVVVVFFVSIDCFSEVYDKLNILYLNDIIYCFYGIMKENYVEVGNIILIGNIEMW